MALNFGNFQEELTTFFRNKDIFTTDERGVTTATDTLTSTGSDTFTLSSSSGVRNIRYVTMAGATQTAYRDYTPTYLTGQFAFTATPSSGTEVVVCYDTGSSDKIYGDLPRADIDRLNYPRMMIKIGDGVTKEFAIGGNANLSNYPISCQIWSTSITRLNSAITDARSNVFDNKKNFYHSPFVTVIGNGQMKEDFERGDKIFTRPIGILARFIIERQS